MLHDDTKMAKYLLMQIMDQHFLESILGWDLHTEFRHTVRLWICRGLPD